MSAHFPSDLFEGYFDEDEVAKTLNSLDSGQEEFYYAPQEHAVQVRVVLCVCMCVCVCVCVCVVGQLDGGCLWAEDLYKCPSRSPARTPHHNTQHAPRIAHTAHLRPHSNIVSHHAGVRGRAVHSIRRALCTTRVGTCGVPLARVPPACNGARRRNQTARGR